MDNHKHATDFYGNSINEGCYVRLVSSREDTIQFCIDQKLDLIRFFESDLGYYCGSLKHSFYCDLLGEALLCLETRFTDAVLVEFVNSDGATDTAVIPCNLLVVCESSSVDKDVSGLLCV